MVTMTSIKLLSLIAFNFFVLACGESSAPHVCSTPSTRRSILMDDNGIQPGSTLRQKDNMQSVAKSTSLLLHGGSSHSVHNAVGHSHEGHSHESSIPQACATPHSLSTDECLHSLMVSEVTGLSNDDVVFRVKRFGLNTLPISKTQSLLSLVVAQFQDKLVQILLVVAFVSALLASFENSLHAFTEPCIILAILILNAVVGVYHSRSAESSLEALKRLQPDNACVLREGTWISELPSSQLVPGDVIYLRAGDKVPADARVLVLKTTTFSTDESSLTGESVTVSKSTEPVDPACSISGKVNMVFSGTMVTNGGCIALVTSTGASTEIGAINEGVQAAQESSFKTPLAERLDHFGDQLSRAILVICVTVWLVSIPKFSNVVFGSALRGAVYYAKIAVALGVAAIPEGLPAVISLCLSLGTARMARRSVIVRKLPSVETLGCTSVICTDKTGTLTTNMMVVKSLVTFASTGVLKADEAIEMLERDVEGVSYEPIGTISGYSCERDLPKSSALQDLAAVCALCNEAQLEYIPSTGTFNRVGEPTEAALKVLVEKLGIPSYPFPLEYQHIPTPGTPPLHDASIDPALLARRCSEFWAHKYRRLAVLEFNRDRKSMSVLCRPSNGSVNAGRDSKSSNRLFVKGAAEIVLTRCSRIKLEDGSIVEITPTIRDVISQRLRGMARRPLRCLAMAYSDNAHVLGDLSMCATAAEAASSQLLQSPDRYVELEQDMVLLGVCGIKDPARPEAREAITRCRAAGIRVMMMTGDSKETAVAIAREVNIFTDADTDMSECAFTGTEFFSLPEARQLELLAVGAGNKVFCRTEPKDKQRLIKMLEKLGEVTAMTGDGVNDAPALQQADIGIAMGVTGTEVAKSAADMVLADDNFATIVTAVEEGRNIYANMQSFICFLISCNMGEIFTIFISTLLGMPEPLTPLHLLWVNLVTDGPPATALGFNPPDPNAMLEPPRSRHESIMSVWMFARYVITGLYVGLATVSAFVWWYLDKGVAWSQLVNWGQCEQWPSFKLSPEYTANIGGTLSTSPCEIFSGASRSIPQSMSLSVLVTVEMLKALSAVSLDSSVLSVPPWRNPWLLLGVTVPFMMHMLVLYVPVLARVFGLAPLEQREWKVVLALSLPIILLEEILKLVGRHRGRIRRGAMAKLKEAQQCAREMMPPPLF